MSANNSDANLVLDTKIEIKQIRQQLFEKMLPVIIIAGFPAFFFVMWRHYTLNNYKLMTTYFIIYFAGIFAILGKRWLSFRVRVIITFGFLYFAGILILFRFGLYSAGPMFLVTFSVLVTVLMGIKYGLIAILISFLAHVFITIGVGLDIFFHTSEEVFHAPPLVLWFQALCLFTMFGGIMVWAPGMLQHKLLNSIEDMINNTKALKRSNKLLWEEMKKSKAIEEELRISEERYRSLSDATFEAVFVIENGICLDANRAACEMFGYNKDDLIGLYGLELIAPQSRKFVEKVIPKGMDKPFEAVAKRKSGENFTVNISSKVANFRSRNVQITVIRDIDEQKRAEVALKDSEERFKTLSDASFEGIVFHRDSEIFEANRRFYEMFGYGDDKNNLVQQMSDVLTSESLVKFIKQLKLAEADPYEVKAMRKDGSPIPIEAQSKIVDYQGEQTHLTAIRDISYRKMAEKKLLEYQMQLRSMASMLTIAEESERRKIAVLLHDGICQSLASSGIKLKMIRSDIENENLKERISEIAAIIEEMLKDTRSLTFELSPPILYEMSLEDALKWLFEQYKEKMKIGGKFVVENFETDLEENSKVLLFHCYRELLINMQKHSNATKIEGSLKQKDGIIEITLKDNGKGFVKQSKEEMYNTSRSGFGLFSIRERIRQFDGKLDIKSVKGQGTSISIYLPEV